MPLKTLKSQKTFGLCLLKFRQGSSLDLPWFSIKVWLVGGNIPLNILVRGLGGWGLGATKCFLPVAEFCSHELKILVKIYATCRKCFKVPLKSNSSCCSIFKSDDKVQRWSLFSENKHDTFVFVLAKWNAI